MAFKRSAWAAHASTMAFVLLWSSGAFFAKVGLAHASAFAFLTLRFALAFGVLLMLGLWRRRWLPQPGTRRRVAITGALLIGCYPICYLLALDQGLTPGVLATVLGVQPLLTLLLFERRLSLARLSGLLLAMAGLVLVVYQGLVVARFSTAGMLFAFVALGSMTAGAILQKGLAQPPMDVLPLQYGVSLLLCALFLPFRPVHAELTAAGFLIPLIWLGLVISVIAQVLLYSLIQAGNLVNVTSLFYLVPAVTAAMDAVYLGNRLPALSLLGMAGILAGLALVFRPVAPVPRMSETS